MIKNYLLIVTGLFFFAGGAYFWKIANTGVYHRNEYPSAPSSELLSTGDIVVVGDQRIGKDDIDWEFSLLTNGLFQDPELTAIPEIDKDSPSLNTLREKLTTNLIERKLLFAFVKQDSDFNTNDPARFESCLKDWQHATTEQESLFKTKQDRERLKSRLCERSIVYQYLTERVFSNIEITDEEMKSYYVRSQNKFAAPQRVIIRQIVLGSEREAKKVRHRVTIANFSSMAKKVSIAPEAENGGLLGPFAKGEMPRVFDVAFSMRTGEIRGILKSTYGFHIITLEEKLPKSKMTYEEALPLIKKALLTEKKEEEYQKWVEMALSAVQVTSPRSL
ncbi:MAG: peptidylprolyl isomerase [Pseudobacteriovorax sp.]|nr:peptidylprolyl isomerase [Pseudobacteriovorax sp.]